jgi:endonuclease-3
VAATQVLTAKQRRARAILARLAQRYPEARCTLDYETPVQLLVATMLSAQCTDERVNQVTPELFARYPDAAALAAAPREAIEAAIRPTGFYRNKAKHIQATCAALTERFGGQVPNRMDELLALPGVARKTANVVLANAYGIHQGVTVDTHVKRLSHRLGLTEGNTPTQIERDLMRLLPQAEWENWSIRSIYHGRAVCRARQPQCRACLLASLCPAAARFDPSLPEAGTAIEADDPIG